MTITQIKTYEITCDGQLAVKDGDGHYMENCTASIEVRGTSKHHAAQSLPKGWRYESASLYPFRCPKEHLY